MSHKEQAFHHLERVMEWQHQHTQREHLRQALLMQHHNQAHLQHKLLQVVERSQQQMANQTQHQQWMLQWGTRAGHPDVAVASTIVTLATRLCTSATTTLKGTRKREAASNPTPTRTRRAVRTTRTRGGSTTRHQMARAATAKGKLETAKGGTEQLPRTSAVTVYQRGRPFQPRGLTILGAAHPKAPVHPNQGLTP